MGFLDKAKQQAHDIKGKVEGKVEDVQGKRKAADLLEELGRMQFALRTGRPRASADADVERLVGELRTLEDQGVVVLPELQPTAPDGADGPTPAAG